jgi:hypothetical protein
MSNKEMTAVEKTAHQILVDYGVKSIGESIGVLSVKKLMVKMAQHQAERMYSEGEVLVLLHKRDKHNLDNPNTFNGWKTPKEWFEQFKKQNNEQ